MSTVKVTLNGVLFPKGRSGSDQPVPCTFVGDAWLTDLGVGGGPMPPQPPVDPGYGVPVPPLGIWGGAPPALPAHPIYMPGLKPEHPIVIPPPPIDPPPGGGTTPPTEGKPPPADGGWGWVPGWGWGYFPGGGGKPQPMPPA